MEQRELCLSVGTKQTLNCCINIEISNSTLNVFKSSLHHIIKYSHVCNIYYIYVTGPYNTTQRQNSGTRNAKLIHLDAKILVLFKQVQETNEVQEDKMPPSPPTFLFLPGVPHNWRSRGRDPNHYRHAAPSPPCGWISGGAPASF